MHVVIYSPVPASRRHWKCDMIDFDASAHAGDDCQKVDTHIYLALDCETNRYSLRTKHDLLRCDIIIELGQVPDSEVLSIGQLTTARRSAQLSR